MNKNANCDGAHCLYATGEVRSLPAGGDSNIILCRECYLHELRWRKDRNRDLADDCKFKLPAWHSLKVYS